MDTVDAIPLQPMIPGSPEESTADESFLSADGDQIEGQVDNAEASSVKIFAFPTDSADEPLSPGRSNRPTPKHEFGGHKHRISRLVFLHDNVHIVSGTYDGTMRKLDCKTGLAVGEPWEGRGGGICALALSPDGKTIACGREDGSVQRWNTDGEMIEGIWRGHSDWVRSLSWSPSGAHLASGSGDGTILVRNAESGDIEVGPIETNQGWVMSVAYSPSGDRVASGGKNGTICIWNSNTGELLVGPIEDLENYVTSLVWSSDGGKLYSADRFVRIFDGISGTELGGLQHDKPPYCVALSPKHNLLACVGYGGIAQLWNTESNQPQGQSFRHEDELYHISFSPDGQYLAYGGEEKKITLWTVKDIKTPSSSCLEVDVTQPFASGNERDNVYDGFFQSLRPSHSFATHDPSSPSPRPRIFSVPYLWNFLIHSRHRTPASESVQRQGHPKRRFFARHAGSQPVIVLPARKKERNVHARRPSVSKKRDPNAQATSASAATNQSPAAQPMPQTQQHTAVQPQSMLHIQQPIARQTTPQHAREEYDYGCWNSFWLAVCFIRPRTRQAVCCLT